MAFSFATTMSMGAILTNQDCDLSDATDIYLKWNEFASETGLYTVASDSVECPGVSPKLHLNAGQTYAFHQTDIRLGACPKPARFCSRPPSALFRLSACPSVTKAEARMLTHSLPTTRAATGTTPSALRMSLVVRTTTVAMAVASAPSLAARTLAPPCSTTSTKTP